MTKFLKIITAILISLFIFFLCIDKYRQYSANQTQISKNTTNLIKVNVDKICKTLAFNAASNLGYYFKDDFRNDTSQKPTNFYTGLKIPGSIYLYTIKGQPKSALFCAFEIKNTNEFEWFLTNILHLKIVKLKGNLNYAKSTTQNQTIYYTNKRLAAVFSATPGNFEPVLLDILNEKNVVKVCDSKFDLVKNSKDHISFCGEENSGALTFNSGKIDFTSEFRANNIVPARKAMHRKLNDENSINFWINANFVNAEPRTFRLKNTFLEKDSLLKNYGGYLDFECTNFISHRDSIITYEYNDDFEKVEKVRVQKNQIPNFLVTLDADAKKLNAYLSRQKFINATNTAVQREIFPLYPVFVSKDNEHFRLSSSKNEHFDSHKIASENFFELDVNFLKLNKQVQFPLLTNYLKNVSDLRVSGKRMEAEKIQISGKLALVDKNINSLYQLLKGF